MNQLTMSTNTNQIEKRIPYQMKSLNKGVIDNFTPDPNLNIQPINSIMNPNKDNNSRIKSREQISNNSYLPVKQNQRISSNSYKDESQINRTPLRTINVSKRITNSVEDEERNNFNRNETNINNNSSLPQINSQTTQESISSKNMNKLKTLAQNDAEFRYNQQKFFDIEPDPQSEIEKNWNNFYEGKSVSPQKPKETRNINQIQKMNTFDGALNSSSKLNLNLKSNNSGALNNMKAQYGLSVMNGSSSINQYNRNSNLQIAGKNDSKNGLSNDQAKQSSSFSPYSG